MRFFIILLLFISLEARDKEFYYSFIDSNGKQISSTTKKSIIDILDEIEFIKNIVKDGKLNEAFDRLSELKSKNKISMLNSDILLLYSQIVLKNTSKKILMDTSIELEEAINSGQIIQEDLLEAYLNLIDLKLAINKVADARYYSKTVIDIFDSSEANARGNISLAKIYKHQKDYQKASKTLFGILTSTKDKNIASIVANELFDIYILDNKIEEAKKLMEQLLLANPSFYSNDFVLANERADLLLKQGNSDLAIDILKDIIKTSKKDDIVETTKYKLANIYMKLNDKTNNYLNSAKIIYKNIIDNYPQGSHIEESQKCYDEIQMRQRLITPAEMSQKYIENELIQQKSLLQELINNNLDKKYADSVNMQKIYSEIPKNVLNRFGYSSVDELLDISYEELIKEYILKDDCKMLNNIIKSTKYEILKIILDDKELENGLISCITQFPNIDNYSRIKELFQNTKDTNTYLLLETMALSVNEIDDALFYSLKIENTNDKSILEKEFLYKYQVLKIKNDPIIFDKFFKNASENIYLIEKNKDEPVIIDFYYDYYLYLIKEKKDDLAFDILTKLNDKQNEYKAYIYTPFVEDKLAKVAKEENRVEDAINYLKNAIKNTRNLKVEYEIKLYYDIALLYDLLEDKEKKDEYIQKCKDVNIENSLYKKMCEGLN